MGAITPSRLLNLSPSKNFLSKKCLPKVQNVGLETLYLEDFRGRVNTCSLSTRSLVCQESAAVCRRIATSCPPKFSNARRRWEWGIISILRWDNNTYIIRVEKLLKRCAKILRCVIIWNCRMQGFCSLK